VAGTTLAFGTLCRIVSRIDYSGLDALAVDNGPEAERIAETADAFVTFLVRHDPHVVRAYRGWAEEFERTRGAGAIAALTGFLSDCVQAKGLVRRLGMERFDWLAESIVYEFFRCRLTELGSPMADFQQFSLPKIDRDAWLKRGGNRRTSGLGLHVEWFYRARVKQPPETPYALGKEYAADRYSSRPRKRDSQESTVSKAIQNVERRLASISKNHPQEIPLIS
jgi:hypothetical protein